MFKQLTSLFKPKKCGQPKFNLGETVIFKRKMPKDYKDMDICTIITDIFPDQYYNDNGSFENGYRLSIDNSYYLWPERLLRKVK